MFRRPVVFIIGAGASADYGMPLGGTLAAAIAADANFYFERSALTRGDAGLLELLRSKCDRDTADRYFEAGRRLAAAISSCVSVDDALYLLSEFPEAVQLGKICIVRSILQAEHNSTLKLWPETGQMRPDAGRDGWIEQMFSMAITNYKLGELQHAFDNVTFINFNYDRCLAHYVYWSLQRVGLTEEDAKTIVGGLSIIRPYGTLGSILPGARDWLRFGATAHLDVFNTMNRIRTYTESEALHDKEHLQRGMMDAAIYIFLGFGFHRQNLELLSVLTDVPIHARSQVLATVYKIDGANLKELRLALQTLVKVNADYIELLPKTAGQMLQDLRPRIMMAAG
jgi:hypothetical protein